MLVDADLVAADVADRFGEEEGDLPQELHEEAEEAA